MKRTLIISLFSALAIVVGLPAPLYAAPMIPDLQWTQRSDWINVKTDVTPAAVGDGVADDTAALQAGLNRIGSGSTLYLPPGTYRITKTLDFDQKRPHGMAIIGHGRSTIIRWDGEPESRMFWAHGGAVSSRYMGITWDGNNVAAVGIDHASKTFETELQHHHEAFRNFTDAGIRIGYRDKSIPSTEKRMESAEIQYTNCLFENSRRGVAFVEFNDYDNTFDGCEFRRCAIGIQDIHGNTFARNCHFEESTESDLSLASEHSSSVRRCTSTNSNRFIDLASAVAALTIQDCHVAGWKSSDGAVQLRGGPVTILDCSFSNPVQSSAPIKLANGDQRLILSNNTIKGAPELLQANNSTHIVALPAGQRKGVITSASQHFLKEMQKVPQKIFDAKVDFGAKGDGVTDDTKSVQQAIDAARQLGEGAMAYLPSGAYLLSDTLKVTGGNYIVAGSGLWTQLKWKGSPDATMMEITDPDHITLQDISVGGHDTGEQKNKIDIHQIGSPKATYMTYDNVAVYGKYYKKPDEGGLRFTGLSPQSTVHLRSLQGNIRFTDSARATVLADSSYEGAVTVEGKDKRRDGFLGFQVRLGTINKHVLYVRDNQSITISDFYIEQADDGFVFQGNDGDPEGRIVIQGSKLGTKEGPITIDNYGGMILLGHNQFYGTPNPTVFSQKGTRPLELLLVSTMFYNTAPEIRHDENTKVSLIANQQKGKANGDTELKDSFSPATAASMLDELRRLGALDIQLNYPEIANGSPLAK